MIECQSRDRHARQKRRFNERALGLRLYTQRPLLLRPFTRSAITGVSLSAIGVHHVEVDTNLHA